MEVIDTSKSFEKCSFVPRQSMKEIQDLVDKVTKQDYPDIDKAEALESLGIMEVFEGNWFKAIHHLESSLKYENVVDRRKPKQLATTRLLLGIARFRGADIKKSIDEFDIAASVGMANDQLEIAAIAMANQAIAYSKTKRMSKAIQAIQQAIHISSKIYRTKSYEHVRMLKILLSFYIKISDFQRAEELVENNTFSESETAILLAGIDYAAGRYQEARIRLTQYNREKKEEQMRMKAQQKEQIAPTATTLSTTTAEQDDNHSINEIDKEKEEKESNIESKRSSQVPIPKLTRFALDTMNESEKSASDKFSTNNELSSLQHQKLNRMKTNTSMSSNGTVTEQPYRFLEEMEGLLEDVLLAHNLSLFPEDADHNNNVNFTNLHNSSSSQTNQLEILKQLELLLTQLQKCKQTQLYTPLANPYLHLPENTNSDSNNGNSNSIKEYHPDFIPLDTYLYPTITYIFLLLRYLETLLLQYFFPMALFIEQGQLIPLDIPPLQSLVIDNEAGKYEKTMISHIQNPLITDYITQSESHLVCIQRGFQQAISILDQMMLITSTSNGLTTTISELMDTTSTTTTNPLVTKLARISSNHSMVDPIDIALIKEYYQSYHDFITISSTLSPSMRLLMNPTIAGTASQANITSLLQQSSVSVEEEETIIKQTSNQISIQFINKLKECYGIVFDSKSGFVTSKSVLLGNAANIKVIGSSTTKHNANSTGPNKHSSKPNTAEAAIAPITTTPITSSITPLLSTGYEAKSLPWPVGGTSALDPLQTTNTNTTATATTTTPSYDGYHGIIHDRYALLSETLLSIDTFGRQDIHYLIQWITLQTSALSFGYFGQAVSNTKDIFSFLELGYLPSCQVIKLVDTNKDNSTTNTNTNNEEENKSLKSNKTEKRKKVIIGSTLASELYQHLITIDFTLSQRQQLLSDQQQRLLAYNPTAQIAAKMNMIMRSSSRTGGGYSSSPSRSSRIGTPNTPGRGMSGSEDGGAGSGGMMSFSRASSMLGMEESEHHNGMMNDEADTEEELLLEANLASIYHQIIPCRILLHFLLIKIGICIQLSNTIILSSLMSLEKLVISLYIHFTYSTNSHNTGSMLQSSSMDSITSITTNPNYVSIGTNIGLPPQHNLSLSNMNEECKIYYLLYLRYRIDYEEWNTPKSFYLNEHGQGPQGPGGQVALGSVEYCEFLAKSLLPWMKQYYIFCKSLKTTKYFYKDACKKLINIYILIGKQPSMTAIHPPTSPKNGSSKHNNKQQQQQPVVPNQSAKQIHQISTETGFDYHAGPPTMHEILSLSPQMIDDYERTDYNWLQRCSKIRAMQYMQEMKSISVFPSAANPIPSFDSMNFMGQGEY